MRPDGVSRSSRIATYETVPLGMGCCPAARYRWARGVVDRRNAMAWPARVSGGRRLACGERWQGQGGRSRVMSRGRLVPPSIRPRPAALRAVQPAIAALHYAFEALPRVGRDRPAREAFCPDGPPAAGGTAAATAPVRRFSAMNSFVSAMKASTRRDQARESRP